MFLVAGLVLALAPTWFVGQATVATILLVVAALEVGAWLLVAAAAWGTYNR